ncbi:unnamed protein product [Leuciscus chuanchicus]
MILEDSQGPHEGPTSDHFTQALRDVWTHLCVLRIQSGAPVRLSHAKENCGRKRPLIEHDARHLKLKSSATEKPQQAGISLAPLLKSSRASWDQPLCPAPDPHFPAAPP